MNKNFNTAAKIYKPHYSQIKPKPGETLREKMLNPSNDRNQPLKQDDPYQLAHLSTGEITNAVIDCCK